jgi:two-component system sensor histidine kinase UhpB
MRERALLVGAALDVGAAPAGGAEVNLLVPLTQDGG